MSLGKLWLNGYLQLLIEGQGLLEWQFVLGAVVAIFFIAMLVPYLLGSINSAVAISRLLYRDDIRRHGSGNAGTTNMLRTYGKVAALLTLLGDVLKTVIAVCFASLLLSADIGGWVAALFCMLGHIFPIYYRFRGGKGVLCVATAIAILSPLAFLCAFTAFVILVAFTKYVSLGSIFAALTLPLFVNFENRIFLPSLGIDALIAVTMALIIVWCHRENIKRIRAGNESKLSFHSKKKSEGEQEGEKK